MVTPLVIAVLALTQVFVVARTKTVSWREAAGAFGVGATACVAASFLMQGLLARLVLAPETVATAAGPFVEEIAKVAPLLWIFIIRRDRRFGLTDGLVLGAALGAGFEFAENTVRALRISPAKMYDSYPVYAPSALIGALTTWFPGGLWTEVRGASGVHAMYAATHAEWTAWAGLGTAAGAHFSRRTRAAWLIALAAIVWVGIDHHVWNHAIRSAFFGPPFSVENLPPLVAPVYVLFGCGAFLRWAWPLAIALALVLDERRIRMGLQRTGAGHEEAGLLLPGERRRTQLGETLLTLASLGWGFAHAGAMRTFLRLRRQMALAAAAEGRWEGSFVVAVLWREVAVASRLAAEDAPAPAAEARRPRVTGLVVLLLGACYALVAWYFLLSVYTPWSWREAFEEGILFWILGWTGLLLAAVSLVLWYARGRRVPATAEDRIGRLSWAAAAHASGCAAFSMLLLGTGLPPYGGSYIWDQVTGALSQVGDSLLGLLSMAMGFVPILGEAKSAVEAWRGRDAVTGEGLSRWERGLAALGAIPILGYAPRLARAGIRATGRLGAAAFRGLDRFTGFGRSARDWFRARRGIRPPHSPGPTPVLKPSPLPSASADAFEIVPRAQLKDDLFDATNFWGKDGRGGAWYGKVGDEVDSLPVQWAHILGDGRLASGFEHFPRPTYSLGWGMSATSAGHLPKW